MKVNRLKTNLAFLIFICSIIFFVMPVSAADTYTCGASVGDQVVLEVTTVHASYSGSIEKGERIKLRVKSVDEAEMYGFAMIIVVLEMWNFIAPGASFASDPELTMGHYCSKDPVSFPSPPAYVSLTPVSSYLAAIAEGYEGYGGSTVTSSGNTMYYTSGYDDSVTAYTFSASNGLIIGMELKDSEGTILYSLSAVSVDIIGPIVGLTIVIGLVGLILGLAAKFN